MSGVAAWLKLLAPCADAPDRGTVAFAYYAMSLGAAPAICHMFLVTIRCFDTHCTSRRRCLSFDLVVHRGLHEIAKGWSRMSSPPTRKSKGMFRRKNFYVCRCVQRLAGHDASSDTSLCRGAETRGKPKREPPKIVWQSVRFDDFCPFCVVSECVVVRWTSAARVPGCGLGTLTRASSMQHLFLFLMQLAPYVSDASARLSQLRGERREGARISTRPFPLRSAKSMLLVQLAGDATRRRRRCVAKFLPQRSTSFFGKAALDFSSHSYLSLCCGDPGLPDRFQWLRKRRGQQMPRVHNLEFIGGVQQAPHTNREAVSKHSWRHKPGNTNGALALIHNSVDWFSSVSSLAGACNCQLGHHSE